MLGWEANLQSTLHKNLYSYERRDLQVIENKEFQAKVFETRSFKVFAYDEHKLQNLNLRGKAYSRINQDVGGIIEFFNGPGCQRGEVINDPNNYPILTETVTKLIYLPLTSD
jgi:hypothetical protein